MSQRVTILNPKRIMHSTNYVNTFIEIAEDSPNQTAEIPPLKGEKKSIANYQFEMIYDHPYQYTSDDVLFTVFAERNGFTKTELEEQRAAFFSKGQACFRASPLTKRYGWGVHSNDEGKIAIFPAGSAEYEEFIKDESVAKTKAMRNKKK